MFTNEEGMAIVGVIITVLILSCLCGVILFLAEEDYLIANYEEASLKALYAAEGGINIVVHKMQKNSDITYKEIVDLCESLTAQKIKVGDAFIDSVVPDNLGLIVKFSVSGICKAAKKTLVAYVSFPSESEIAPILKGLIVCSASGFSSCPNQVINGDIYSNGPVNIRSGTIIHGDIWSSETVNIEQNAQVHGNIFSREAIEIADLAVVTGTIQEYLNGVPNIPIIPSSDHVQFLKEQAIREEGHYFFEEESPKLLSEAFFQEISGVYYVEGDVNIGDSVSTYSGNAVIVANGMISISNDLFPQDSASTLALVSTKDLHINQGASIKAVLIVGAGLKSNESKGNIIGIIAANNLDCCVHDFTSDLETIKGLEDYLGLNGKDAELQLWKEKYDIY